MTISNKSFFKSLLLIQGIYYLVTALWGILDIDSFMSVTGPKNDIWLVKTVSTLIIPIALCLLSFLYVKYEHTPALVLGLTSTAGFAIIDFYYASTDVISNIYMVDGAVQLVLFMAWIVISINAKRNNAG